MIAVALQSRLEGSVIGARTSHPHSNLKQTEQGTDMTKQDGIKELEELLRDADKAISEDEDYIRGWKSALLVALEIITKLS